jgi:hypothetical protein
MIGLYRTSREINFWSASLVKITVIQTFQIMLTTAIYSNGSVRECPSSSHSADIISIVLSSRTADRLGL